MNDLKWLAGRKLKHRYSVKLTLTFYVKVKAFTWEGAREKAEKLFGDYIMETPRQALEKQAAADVRILSD